MKKIATLAVLPVIALASCSKWNEAPVETSKNVDTTTSEVNTLNETWATENLNNNISTTTTESWVINTKDFTFDYDLYWTQVKVAWKFSLNKWVISSISFDWTEFEKWQQPLKMFTDKMSQDLVWKELKGLSIDTLSWASLVSWAFNKYLSSLK